MSNYAIWILYAGIGALVVLAVVLAVVAILALWRRIVFKIALRNVLRVPLQTGLAVFGLMISTAIIAAALAIGDTVNTSVRADLVERLGHTDIVVTGADIQRDKVDEFVATKTDPLIDGVLVASTFEASVLLERTFRAEANTELFGVDTSSLDGFGTLEALEGNVDVSSLSGEEGIINRSFSELLQAQVGDQLTVATFEGERKSITVVGIAENGGLASNGNRILLERDALNELVEFPANYVSRVDISVRGGTEPLLDTLRDAFPVVNGIAAAEDGTPPRDIYNELVSILPEIDNILESLLMAGPVVPDGGDGMAPPAELPPELAELLRLLRAQDFDAVEQDFLNLIQSPQVQQALDEVQTLASALGFDIDIRFGDALFDVDEVKTQAIGEADFVGIIFTTIFSFFGSFSIISGVLLIILIFVLLAASRQQEMGIARAIGMKRGTLVLAYIFEGVIYSLLASAVGVALGTGTAFLIVDVFVQGAGTEEVVGNIIFSTSPQALLLAYAVGTIVTMITVTFSSIYVGQLNIVTAIRGLPPEFVRKATLRSEAIRLLGGPIRTLIVPNSGGRGLAIFMLVLAALISVGGFIASVASADPNPVAGLSVVVLAVVAVWAIYGIARIVNLIFPVMRSGVPLLAAGITLYLIQRQVILDDALPEGTMPDGFFDYFLVQRVPLLYLSVILMSAGGLALIHLVGARYVTRQARGIFTGLVFGAFATSVVLQSLLGAAELNWLYGSDALPPDGAADTWFFVLAAVILVGAPIMAVIALSSFWVFLLNNLLGRLRGFSTSFSLAVAYVFAARFRTGLTMMTFSLVIFSLVLFSTLTSIDAGDVNAGLVTRGFDVSATSREPLEEGQFEDVVAQSPRLESADFEFIATSENSDGLEGSLEDGSRRGSFRVELLGSQRLIRAPLELALRNPAYPSDRSAWAALDLNPNLVILDSNAYEPTAFGGGPGEDEGGLFTVPEIVDNQFPAINVYFDGQDDMPAELQVIGVVASADSSFFPTGYTGVGAAESILGRPVRFSNYFIALRDGADGTEIATLLEGAFVDFGFSAVDLRGSIEAQVEAQQAFTRLFQGFMGLGLAVGTVALGVIAFRSVVERRRSIGITRAIGLRAPFVGLQFVLESAIVALISVGIGIGTGVVQSNQIFDAINENNVLEFVLPWDLILAVVAIVLAASILITLGVAIQAARIKPAETIRFE